MRRDVRILLVGDDGAGKSTLITSLIKEQFIPNIQHVVPEVTIPPEVTPENVTTHIVDSSARSENRAQLELEIRKAHVICVVYAVDDQNTFDRIPSYWLPLIKSLGVNVPIVLVGNKIDVRGDDVTNNMLEEEILPIMTDFKEVETCVECSAKLSLNISEVFYFAQKAVLHPTAPLYDSRDHVLKPACVDALKRIFRLCDLDKDGSLSNDELNDFQRKCFDAPLQQQELEAVKEVVLENDPGGISEAGITEAGFLYLHTLFIQKGRLETTWTVLRKFGYGEDLSLRDDYLCPPLDVPADCRVELSSTGHAFFTDLFRIHDLDKDGALSAHELEDLFATSPGVPWAQSNFADDYSDQVQPALTLQSFLSQWAMITLLQYKSTLEYLAYLGFEGDTRTGLRVVRSVRGPRGTVSSRRGNGRSTFLCSVFGAAGSGKTGLLRKFAGRPYTSAYQQSTRAISVVNTVEVKGSEIYLVMQEYGSKYELEVLQNRKKLELCDVACFVYDSSDVNSFAYIANQIKQLDVHIPCIILATKSDLDLVQQRYDHPPDVFCRNLGLDKPIHISVKHNVMANLFDVIASIAMNPSSAIPKLQEDHGDRTSNVTKYLAITAAVGALIAVGFAGWRAFRT
ncbi:mitochondrial Rho 1 [Blastocladiella britannica]|nr:mitochondrial Rho 1 [Blastocladiella britannica]